MSKNKIVLISRLAGRSIIQDFNNCLLGRGLKSYIIPRHKLGLDFLRSQIFKKLICGGHFEFQ